MDREWTPLEVVVLDESEPLVLGKHLCSAGTSKRR